MINQRRRKSKSHTFEISLTPLIDTLLVLLVILMVTTPIIHNSALDIHLPKAHTQGSPANDSTETQYVVYIDKNENILFDDKLVNHDELAKNLAQRIGQKSDQRVYINADKETKYEALVKVIDSIKYLAGVENVVLSADRA